MNTVLHKGKRLFGILTALICLSFLGCGSSGGGGETPPPAPTTYTVTFIINGGLYGSFGNTKDVVISEIEPGTLLGDLARKPAPIHLDYTKDFVSWNTEADGSGEFYENYNHIDGDITLYAFYADDLAVFPFDLIECDEPSAIYTLSADVSIAAADISDLLCPGSAFMGRIYGKGNTVTYTLPAVTPAREYAGLFEKLDGALINGLNVSANVSGVSSVGVLAAIAQNSVIEYVKVSGTPTASGTSDAFAGGVAGTLDNSTVRFVKSTAAASVSLTSTGSAAGGIAGKVINGGEILSGSSSGYINGSSAGGIAGVMESNGKITASVSSGVLSGGTVGGIAAKVEATAEIAESYTLNPSITGTVAAGGIAGSVNGGSVKDSVVLGNLINGDNAELGRIAGEAVSGDLSNSFARGDMLINYEKVTAGGKNGSSKAVSEVRKNRGFFETDLGWDLESEWFMPDYYEYPQTLNDLYTEIKTVEEFQAIADSAASVAGRYVLMNDIDFSGVTEWVSIGSGASSGPFSGELFGGGKVIKNFNREGIPSVDTSYGIFNSISGGVLRDVRIDNATVAAEPDTRGNPPSGLLGLVAVSTLNINFDRVHVTNSRVTGGSTTGGFIGGLTGQRNYIIESSFEGEVSANYTPSQGNFLQAAGGFFGGQHYGYGDSSDGSHAVILSSYTKGIVSQNQVSTAKPGGGIAWAGGLIGSGTNYTLMYYTIINSYSESDIYALGGTYTMAGGLIGYLPNKSMIKNSYSAGDIRAAGGAITAPIASTNIRKAAGGLMASFTDTASSIKLIGSMAFNGTLTITDNVAATFTGANRSQTFGRIAAGKRSSNSVGTLVAAADIVLEDVYYNSETVFDASGMVGNNITPDYTELTNEAGHGVTLPQPQSFYEAAGWDFEYTWKMPEGGGLPVLQWEE
jgi:hypothetical protein